MSNLLLVISTALAQDCPPDPASLVAVPGDGATDVPFDLTPKILFADGCSDDLDLILYEGERPWLTATAVRGDYNPSSGWYLSENTSYTVEVQHQGLEIRRWSFTTGNERAVASMTPTHLSLDYAWTESIDDDVTQHIELTVEFLSEESRVFEIIDPESQQRLFAGTTTGEAGGSELISLEFPIGFAESDVCLEIVEYDHVGGTATSSDCVNNSLEPPNFLDPDGCSTAGGVSGGALVFLSLLGLSRRRRSLAHPT